MQGVRPGRHREDKRAAWSTGWVPYGIAGVLLAASSSDRLEKVLVRQGTTRPVGGSLAEAQAPLALFLPALVLAAVVCGAFVFLLCLVVKRMSGRWVMLTLIAVGLGACIAFFIVYPRLGVPQSASGFGDEDDAINILISSVLNGQNPYTVQTYIGNPVSPLMGNALVGAPFYFVFGSAGYQNPFLLALLLVVCSRWLGPRVALVTAVASFSSLGFTEYFLVGGDYFLVGALAAACSYFYLADLYRGGTPTWSALLLATAACTRMSFLVIAFVAVGVGLLVVRKRSAIVGGGLVVGISAALVIPWLLATGYNSFFPLQAARLLGPPHLQLASVGLIGLSVVYVLLRRDLAFCYLVGVAAVPVLFVDPGQLFRVSSFVWWGVALFAAAVCLVAERPGLTRQGVLASFETSNER